MHTLLVAKASQPKHVSRSTEAFGVSGLDNRFDEHRTEPFIGPR